RDRGGLQGRHRRRLFLLDALERDDLRQSDPMIKDPRLVRAMQAGASTLVILVLWQLASLFFPPYLFPSVPDIVKRVVDIFLSAPLLVEVLVTAARIFAGLLGAFLLGGLMALVIVGSPAIESCTTPVLSLL